MGETVFITGATGMLGQALLPKLCAQATVEKVLVLGHRNPPGFSHSKMEVVPGDVSYAGMGLQSGSMRAITTIIHSAALTSFSSALETARQVNVTGTENMLRLALDCPRLRAICHLSTMFVAGRRTGTIYEDELTHDCGFVNAYEQSKYEAEQLLGSAQRLPISTVRLSAIFGDSREGGIGRLGSIHHALRFIFHSLAPFVPGTPASPVDLIPLDYAAESVTALAFPQFTPGATWHVCGGADALPLEEMLELTLQLFYRYRPAWRKRAIEKPAIVDLETFELFVKSVEEVGESALKDSVALFKHFAPQLAYPKRFNDAATLKVLEREGIIRPQVREYFPKVVRFLLENNWQATARMQATA